MNPIPDVIERLKALFFRGRLERELEEELRDHIAREAEARSRAGSAFPGREALAVFGGVERVKDEVREARGVLPWEDLVADTRYALRALRRNAGFTLTVVAVLGVGLGAATAVFAVVNRVLLTGLPYPDPSRLVRIYQKNSPTNLWSLSVVDVQAIAEQQRTLEAFGAARYASASLSGIATPERVAIGRVTSGFFRALGVGAARGRLIEPDDDRPGAPAVVVVSHRLAERVLGGASAVGRAIAIDGVSHAVVGVLEPGRGELAGMEADAWPILRMDTPTRRGPFGLRAVARLKEGVTLAQATRDLAGISARIFPIWASGFQDQAARLTPVPLRDAVLGSANQQIGLFAGAVGLVLLLAVANVATLMLVRTSAREHELLVRSALGAGRRRLARLIATEGMVLATLGGLVGVGIAAFCLGIVGLVAPNLPRLDEVALDRVSLAFAALAALAAGVLITLAPFFSVLATASSVGSSSLAASPARSGTGRHTHRIRGALVTLEFALALPLVLGAGLLLTSFLRLQRVDPGFDPRGVFSLALSLPGSRYGNGGLAQQFWRLAEVRAAETPGVTAAGLSGSIPPDNGGDVNNFDLLDKPVPAGTGQPVAPWSAVTPGYFEALGIPLLEGRLLTLADSDSSPPVVVVSRAWAAKYYPETSAVGRQLHSGGCSTCPPTTVVGVVGDVPYLGLASGAEGVYAPLAQQGGQSLHLVVRSRLGPAATFRALRAAIASLDPDLAPVEIDMTDHLRRALGDPRRWTALVGAFAAAGVLLAALGVFGLMSYVVRQRRSELGVRLALGASPRALTRLVVQRGMRYAVLGTLIGLGLSAFESRWLGSLLFGVEAGDPITLGIAVAVLLAVAAIACWIPGLRAARIKPREALCSD